MSKHLKAIDRLLSRPKDYTYNEKRTLLGQLGYSEYTKGKTSGSRVMFWNSETNHIINLHKPHPGNIVKSYAIDELIDCLKEKGLI